MKINWKKSGCHYSAHLVYGRFGYTIHLQVIQQPHWRTHREYFYAKARIGSLSARTGPERLALHLAQQDAEDLLYELLDDMFYGIVQLRKKAGRVPCPDFELEKTK
jgi:hypothetical protein